MSEHAFDWLAPHSDERARRPELPSADPFHDVPDDLLSLQPGTVVRSRQVRLGFLGLVAQRGLQAWQLAYRSTDRNGDPRSRSPRSSSRGRTTPNDRSGSLPTSAPSTPSPTGASPPMRCASAPARRRAAPDRAHPDRGPPRRGYVVSPLRPRGSRGLLRRPARARLPRARRRPRRDVVPADRDDPSTPVGLLGYSGGGMASAWAAEMARLLRAGDPAGRRRPGLTGRRPRRGVHQAQRRPERRTPGTRRRPGCSTPTRAWAGSCDGTRPTRASRASRRCRT